MSARNLVDISVDLDAGVPLGQVKSPYHDVDIATRFEHSADVVVAGAVPADRDFYLSWEPRELAEPYLAVFTEQPVGDEHYVAMVTPPSAAAIGDTRRPREVIFVQDTSGSMGGESLAQARAGLVMALQRLDEDDTFNVIEFNSTYTSFAADPVQATRRNVDRAVEFVQALVATGGTEMKPALEAALDDADSSDGRLRQVVFLTDGGVTNELQMLNLIDQDLGQSRLFTVGIGSAPNSYFMTAAARSGRGSFVFIGDLAEVNTQMQMLFKKIETPAIVDLAIDGFSVDAVVSPSPLPDLYAGDPVVLTVRVPAGVETDSMRLTGRQGGDEWHMDIDLINADIRPGVSKLWAREHIRDLEALRVSPEITPTRREGIDDTILATALDFGLVSRLTSLVAVDVEVTRPEGTESVTTEIPTNLPKGWDPDIFFNDTGNADDHNGEISAGALDRLSAAAGTRELGTSESGLPFAATGSDWQIQAIIGAAFILLAGSAYVATGRRSRR